MAYDPSLLAQIDAAIASGIDKPGEVESSTGRRIKYRSLTELSQMRESIAAQANTASGKLGIRRTLLAHGRA